MTLLQNQKYIAFLRAVNVGGNNMVSMSDLKILCEKLGLEQVRTYIQSGNILFESRLAKSSLTEKLEIAIGKLIGKHIPVIVLTMKELTLVLENNPFPKEIPTKVGVMFFPRPIEKDFLSKVSTTTEEKIKPGRQELYIYYPNGMGRSKLKLPRSLEGTVRNINTLQKILSLSTT